MAQILLAPRKTGMPEAPPEAAGCMIEVRNLQKRYQMRKGAPVVALQDIDFSIRDGEFISVVGPSGCGKSTLLKILAGLLSYNGGSAQIGRKPVKGPSPEVGVVFQTPVLLPWRNIIDNVLLPVELRRMGVKSFRDRAFSLLEMVGLKGFESRFPFELSGGMQQRAAIVRALLQDPPILLMDEPFGALDAMTREQMNVEVLKIWSAHKKTVLFVTHSITESVFLADRVFVMTPRPGRIAAIIEIDLPRPRTLSTINTDAFGFYAERIRSLLQAKGDLSA